MKHAQQIVIPARRPGSRPNRRRRSRLSLRHGLALAVLIAAALLVWGGLALACIL